MSAKRRRILAIVATDRTFEPSRHGTSAVWVGSCIHCKSPLTVAADGRPISQATIEHIWPQRHGGGNDLDNLALACGSCNRGKSRHDRAHRTDPRLNEIVAELRRRRAERWRDPPAELSRFVAWARREDGGGDPDADDDDPDDDPDDDLDDDPDDPD